MRQIAKGERGTANAVSVASDPITIGKELVNDCVRYSSALNLLYLNNPKCGCTTVKHSLWLASDAVLGSNTFDGNVHDRKADPFAKNLFRLTAAGRERIAQAVVFSVVRNPFARALSAYVDKVANDPAVWPTFLKRFGLRPDVGKKELSFPDFLRLVALAHDDILDGHFRPQCRNLLLPLAAPVFVGSVEDMKPVGRFLAKTGIVFRDERMNATHARAQLNRYYDGEAAGLVRARYAKDFARFGYSTDLADVDAGPKPDKPSMHAGGPDRLLHWVGTGEAPEGLCLNPGEDFSAFSRTRDVQEKLRIAGNAFAREHNWSRLRRYAGFAGRKAPDEKLRDAILGRMVSLRSRYASAVGNRDIFVDFP